MVGVVDLIWHSDQPHNPGSIRVLVFSALSPPLHGSPCAFRASQPGLPMRGSWFPNARRGGAPASVGASSPRSPRSPSKTSSLVELASYCLQTRVEAIGSDGTSLTLAAAAGLGLVQLVWEGVRHPARPYGPARTLIAF